MLEGDWTLNENFHQNVLLKTLYNWMEHFQSLLKEGVFF